MNVWERWDFKAMVEGLRAAAESPKDQVAITRHRLVEAADALEDLLFEFHALSSVPEKFEP